MWYKHLFIVLSCVALSAGTLSANAAAQDQIVITISGGSGQAGTIGIPVDISVKNLSSRIPALKLQLSYNAAAGIHAIEGGEGQGYALTERTAAFKAFTRIDENGRDSKVNISLLDPTETGITPGTGAIFTVFFRVDESVTAEQEIPLRITGLYVSDRPIEDKENLVRPQKAATFRTLSKEGVFTVLPAPLPTVTISDITADEGAGHLSFQIALSAASSNKLVTLSYRTSDATAVGDRDYTASSGTLSIQAGQSLMTLNIPIIDDSLDEADETFLVLLSDPVNAELRDAEGLGTITDNDDLPALSIDDVTAEENMLNMAFTVRLAQASEQPVSVEFTTVDGSAKAADDYTSRHGTLTFAPGETSHKIEVPITFDEATKEDDEDFFVKLAAPVNAIISNPQGKGTIQNTYVSFVGLRRAIGRPVPEPSTYALMLLGLLAIGWLRGRTKR